MDRIIHNEVRTKVVITQGGNEEVTVMHLSLCKESLQQLLNVFSSEVITDEEAHMIPDAHEYAEFVFIRRNSSYKKVAVRDIVYLEAERNYCNIHLSNETCINVSIPMNEVLEYLIPSRFKRVHRSFVVNLEYVEVYMGNILILSNKRQIDIGREYREMIEKEFVCIGSRKRVREKKQT